MRLLIAHRDAPERSHLLRALQHDGAHQLTLAGDAQQLSAHASHEQAPDAVLLDVSLPGLSLALACRELRARCPTAPPLVLCISATPDPGELETCLRAGA